MKQVQIRFNGVYADEVTEEVKSIVGEKLLFQIFDYKLGDGYLVNRGCATGVVDTLEFNKLFELTDTKLRGKAKMYVMDWRRVEHVLPL